MHARGVHLERWLCSMQDEWYHAYTVCGVVEGAGKLLLSL